jgi:type IV secretory pathway TraG/TraD family ATPase VirD4
MLYIEQQFFLLIAGFLLIDRDFSQTQPSENEEFYYRDQVYIESDEKSVCLVSSAENVSLMGDYCVRIQLTKEEVANLARIALGSMRFDQVVELLSDKRPTPVACAGKASA